MRRENYAVRRARGGNLEEAVRFNFLRRNLLPQTLEMRCEKFADSCLVASDRWNVD
jgi:hypothetical protein